MSIIQAGATLEFFFSKSLKGEGGLNDLCKILKNLAQIAACITMSSRESYHQKRFTKPHRLDVSVATTEGQRTRLQFSPSPET